MSFSIPIPQNSICVFFIIIIIQHLFYLSLSDPRITQAALLCGTPQSLQPTSLIPNFVRESESIAEPVSNHGWASHTFGSSPSLYGLAQCYGDLSKPDCLLCFTESRNKIPGCIAAVSARVFLDGCFLRFDNYSFFEEPVDHRLDTVRCSSRSGVGVSDEHKKLEFGEKVDEVIRNVTEIAVTNGGFGVAEVMMKKGVVGVYALAQCWNTLSDDGCRSCLIKAGKNVRRCVPGSEGRGLNAGCYLRYSTEKFYNDGVKIKGEKGFLSQTAVVVVIVIGSMGFSLLALFGACVGYTRLSTIRQECNNLGRLPSTVDKSNFNFKYETLEMATDSFDPSRKVGQGGAGSVFKGTLPDGRTVAVKRLFFNTRQWVDQFFNEVNLISEIQHKNLVKLLGCSIEGPESLLVYEYLPNKSLDQILFDKNKTQILSWRQRFDIIVGTAEGLAFLHGESEVRIIHRDIKSSNILLDENLNAKIADFGLARCFAADKTHLSTGIAGTLGYMAPEYLIRGQLTEKADVYSFGVLVLEIVCGRKNNVFTQESDSVLQTVWKYYKMHKFPESVDPSLKNDFPAKEASNVLQIGLLCTQASASLRPSIAKVVQMLTDTECAIPLPKQPPFLNASVLGIDASNSMNHSRSDEPTTIDISYNSTKSFNMISPTSEGLSDAR